MRVLRILAPGTDEALARSVREAVATFNRGLDIRLRFLAIGVEDREARVAEPEDAARQVGAELEAFRPDVVVVQGHGAAALAAATTAARGGGIVVRLGAGDRGGPDADADRAVDRVSDVLLPLGDDALAVLGDEGLAAKAMPLPRAAEGGLGPKVIKALRAAHVRGRGESTC